jgi:TolA-binding protein
VVTEHAGTTAAGSAMVLLANSQWTAGKQDDAIATLRKFIAESPGHPAVPNAKANLASKLMAQGKSGDAAKLFEEIAADPAANFIAPFALISLGDIAKNTGDLEKAEASYTKAKNVDSSFADTASRRLAILKTKPPVEIEPPPAPPAAETKPTPPPGATLTPSAPETTTPAAPQP